MSKRNKKKLLYLIFLLIISGLFYLYDNYYNNESIDKRIVTNASGDLVVQFIDVGEADCTLISNNGHNMLIDAGNNRDGKLLVNYFKSIGINKFDYLITTHSHEDHIGGMNNIIKSFEIDKFYIPNVSVDNMTYKEVIKSLNNKNINKETPSEDSIIELGNSKLKVLSIRDDKEDLNKDSIVLKLYYGNISLLFMGDAPSDIEHSILNKDLKSNVLRVGHHGSRYSTSANFLYKVHPEYSIISVGNNNDYGHPHKVTIDKLNRVNSKIYRTDLNGTIIMTSDGNNISFKTIKTNTNGD